MNCRETVEFLRHYLDDELPENVRSCFDMHLRLCPSCVDFLDTYRNAIRLAHKAGEEVPATGCEALPESLVTAILHARRQDRTC